MKQAQPADACNNKGGNETACINVTNEYIGTVLCFTSSTLYEYQLTSLLLKQDSAVISNHSELCEVTHYKLFFACSAQHNNRTPLLLDRKVNCMLEI